MRLKVLLGRRWDLPGQQGTDLSSTALEEAGRRHPTERPRLALLVREGLAGNHSVREDADHLCWLETMGR